MTRKPLFLVRMRFLTKNTHCDMLLVMNPEGLFEETRLLFHALKHWSETLHAELGMTAPMRGVQIADPGLIRLQEPSGKDF